MAGASRRTEKSFRAAAKRIELLGRTLTEKNIRGLRVIGEEIMLDVKASRPGHGVPVATGVLRSSGRVRGLLKDVELSFGGAAAPYALEVHENVAMSHRVGESRYLVRGLDRWQANGASVRLALAQLKRAVDELTRKKHGGGARGIGVIRRRGRAR